MQFDVEVIVSPELERLYRTGSAVVAEEVVAATEASLALIEGAIKPLTSVGVAGALRGATASEVRGSTAEVLGRVFNPLGYAVPVEEGSKPHTANLRAIEQWAKRKLNADASAAYRIWRSIQRKGTKPHAFFAPGLAAVRERVLDRFAVIPDRVAARLAGGAA